jgi:DNA-binding beta-propeller fold protein YncE
MRSRSGVVAAVESLEPRIALTAAPTSGALDSSLTPLGVVYVLSNDWSGPNSVVAYKRQSDGSHTLMGKYETGGAGLVNANDRQGPDNNDRPIVVSRDRKWLFAVNGGDDTITSFRIHDDGSLSRVQTRASGGTRPVSLEIIRDKLYVLNKGNVGPGDDGPNDGATPPQLRILRIKSNGQLARFDDGALSFYSERGSSASTVIASPDDKSLFIVATFFDAPVNRTQQLFGWRVLPDGSLTSDIQKTSGPTLLQSGMLPTLEGAVLHPDNTGHIYVGLAQSSGVAIFRKSSVGRLSYSGAVPASVHEPSHLTTDADGEFLYVVAASGNAVSVFSLADPNIPELLQVHLLRGPRQSDNFLGERDGAFATVARQTAIDPTGQRLYVVNQERSRENEFAEGNQLHVLNIGSDGLLSEPSAPMIFDTDDVPGFAHPQGVVPV